MLCLKDNNNKNSLFCFKLERKISNEKKEKQKNLPPLTPLFVDNPYNAATSTHSPTSWSRCYLLLLLTAMTLMLSTPSSATLISTNGSVRTTDMSSSPTTTNLHLDTYPSAEQRFYETTTEHRTKTIATLLTVNDG